MNFDSVNYLFMAQDVLFCMGAGFGLGLVNNIFSFFICKGKIRLFVKDIFVSLLFAVTVFSFTISFANYAVVRYYHIIAAFWGFWAANFHPEKISQKIWEKFSYYFKNKILYLLGKIKSIICVCKKNFVKKPDKRKNLPEKTDLQKNETVIYNI